MKKLLRPVRQEDLAMILEWRNAPAVRNNMYTNHVISPEEHAQWWKRMCADQSVRLLLLEDDGEALGFVSFTNYTGRDGTATWAFYSGHSSKKGVGSMMEQAALEYAFEDLKLYRLECEVLSFNQAVVDFHARHGFEIEGVAKRAYERDGKRHSIYRLSMLRETWEKYVRPMLQSENGIRGTLAGLRLVWTDKIEAEVVDQYSKVTGDDNPVHLDDNSAQAVGFAKRIAHGMLLGGRISRYFAHQFPGPGTIYLSQDLRFKAPVFVGETVQHELKVDWHLGKKVGVTTHSKVGERECVHGNAVLMLPPGNWSKEDFL